MKSKKSNTLLAIGTAAGIAVYAAGFARTADAANRQVEGERRRPPPDETREPGFAQSAVGKTSTDPQQSIVPIPASVALTTAAAQQVVFSTEDAAKPKPAPTGHVLVTFMPNPATGARAALEFVEELPAALAKWKDGRWFGWGTSRHGNMKVEVQIADGRITECVIAECYTNYDAWSVRNLTNQVVTRQSYNIGSMSGSTQSSDAFYYAVVEALQAAKKAAM